MTTASGSDAKSRPRKRKKVNKAVLTHLRTLREALGLDLTTLARMLNLSESTVSSWERGVRRPLPEGWRRLRVILTRWIMEQLHLGRKEATEFLLPRLIPQIMTPQAKKIRR